MNLLCVGVWDLLHEGHIKFLFKASKIGILTVGIVADEAVKVIKGNNRPAMPLNERQKLLNEMGYKTVIVPDFIFPSELIAANDYVIVGEDQQHFKNIADIPYEKKIIFPRYPGISTSKIIATIKGEKC